MAPVNELPQQLQLCKLLLIHALSSQTNDYVTANLSNDSPQAITETLGGNPIGRSISGRKTPEFPTSTHFLSPLNKKIHYQTLCLNSLKMKITFMVTEHFHTWFCVGIISWFKAKTLNS